jgi:hypothetical protein
MLALSYKAILKAIYLLVIIYPDMVGVFCWLGLFTGGFYEKVGVFSLFFKEVFNAFMYKKHLFSTASGYQWLEFC